MTTKISANSFVDAVIRSGLLEESVADQYRGQAPDRLAYKMIEDGVLTQFQARQLIGGRYRGFFIGEKYKILDSLGKGGMGRVMLCEHLMLQRLVAVKLMFRSRDTKPGAIERFLQEARAAARFDHPNLARVFDVDNAKQGPFIVMEYVDGTNLHDLIAKHGWLSPVRAANYVRQAALGLEQAHQSGLVHRDIKPGNLMLDRHGCIKMLDLGLARFFDESPDNGLTSAYNPNAVLGTADFIAPEQALDCSRADIRADIYSLGCTFYFLLTRSLPAGEGTTMQKLLRHQSKEPEPIRKKRLDVSEELVAIIARMMKKDPDARFQTPAEVAEALLPFAGEKIPPPTVEEMPPARLVGYKTGMSASASSRAILESERDSATLSNGPQTTDLDPLGSPSGGITGLSNGEADPLAGAFEMAASMAGAIGPASMGPGSMGPGSMSPGSMGPGSLAPGALVAGATEQPARPPIDFGALLKSGLSNGIDLALRLPVWAKAGLASAAVVALLATGYSFMVWMTPTDSTSNNYLGEGRIRRGPKPNVNVVEHQPDTSPVPGQNTVATNVQKPIDPKSLPSPTEVKNDHVPVVIIRGGGSTMIGSVMEEWAKKYELQTRRKVEYVKSGSSKGVEGVLSRFLDYGCSDAPLTEAQIQNAGVGVQHVPLVMGAVVPTYNLTNDDGRSLQLRFNGRTLADIFLGKITKWNAEQIQINNPDVKLPDLDIKVVVRKDGSGTTNVWTDYLTKVSAEFKSKVGVGNEVKWPAGFLRGDKSVGVTNVLNETIGSIGYVELSNALQSGLGVGAVQNKQGTWVKPTVESITAAAAGASPSIPPDFRYSLTNPDGIGAYPIVGTCWALICVDLPDEKRKDVVDFLLWATGEGQNHVAALRYGRLPPELGNKVQESLKKIREGQAAG